MAADELVCRFGHLAFVWPERSSWVRVVRPFEDGTLPPGPEGPGPSEALMIEVPPGLKQEAEPFEQWCKKYLGQELAPLSKEEAEAIADCISVTGRMATSYEVYGGVEVAKAAGLAQQALERLDQVIAETQVEDQRV